MTVRGELGEHGFRDRLAVDPVFRRARVEHPQATAAMGDFSLPAKVAWIVQISVPLLVASVLSIFTVCRTRKSSRLPTIGVGCLDLAVDQLHLRRCRRPVPPTDFESGVVRCLGPFEVGRFAGARAARLASRAAATQAIRPITDDGDRAARDAVVGLALGRGGAPSSPSGRDSIGIARRGVPSAAVWGGNDFLPCHQSMQASRPLRRSPSTAAPSVTWRPARAHSLLLIHGMAGTARNWETVIEPLALHNTVVAPDFPGHGNSAPGGGDYSLGSLASGLRDLMVALGHDRATLVGHSLGGGVALQFAYQFPEMVERLVLVSSGGLGPEVGMILRAAALPGADLFLRATAAPGAVAGSWVTGVLGRVGLRPSADLAEVGRAYALARRHRPPQGLPLDPPRGRRHRRPAGRRPRPPLPRRDRADADHLGRARPDHPRRPRPRRPRPAAGQPPRGLPRRRPHPDAGEPRPLRRRPAALPRRHRARRIRRRRVARPLQRSA